MKGAFLISTDPELFQQVNEILVAKGGSSAPDRVVQVSNEDGSLFTVYGDLGDEFAVDLAEGVDETRGEFDSIPELSVRTSCWIECRSGESFVEWVTAIAEARSTPTWVLDGDGVLWTVESLKPAEVRL